ncbi:P-loop ATPase, Sll1717 family [Roseivivax sp. CAU 1753]
MTDLLNQISRWKLEAADEDSHRYFYHAQEVDDLENGMNSMVIGRKGAGKTAICRYFETDIKFDQFSTKLSFKEFPFNILYALEDKAFTTPSQYISLWKYLVYNSVLMLMMKNQNVGAEFHSRMSELYSDDEFKSFNSRLQSWTEKSFGAGILSLSGKYDVKHEIARIEDIWQDLIPAMETLIIRNIDDSKYFIVFDELDEDFRNYWENENRVRYLSLITSLLKATSNVRRIFSDNGCKVFPIVFLRDDIYELLVDPDKAKWEDNLIHLSWKKSELKNLLAFRLARSRDPQAETFNFDKEWGNLFQKKDRLRKGEKDFSEFDSILSLTHSRPRDFVRILKDAAKLSIRQGHKKITSDTIRGIDGDYSTKFREELVNEINGVIPDISNLLAHFGGTHKQRHPYTQFIEHIEDYQETEECDEMTKKLPATAISKILFHFSIIGNANRRNNQPIFKYQRTHLTINPSEPIVFHRGLLKTMGLH